MHDNFRGETESIQFRLEQKDKGKLRGVSRKEGNC